MLEELARRRWTAKAWTTKAGTRRGGVPFTKRTLLRLLTNALFRGDVEFKGTLYKGEHASIVEPGVWDKVNAELRGARRGERRITRSPQGALLRGLLYCGSCTQPMTPTHTAKGDRRFRYYFCRTARKSSYTSCPTRPVAARVIEASVIDQVRLALQAEEAREQLQVPEAEWLAYIENSSEEFLRRLIERVVYGARGAVSLELGLDVSQ